MGRYNIFISKVGELNVAYVYKIINQINQKVYIGTTKYNPEQRWKEHLNRYKQLLKQGNLKYPIYLAFDKYGIENFNIETIEKCDESEMFDKERYYVKLYDAYGQGGYNATIGGGGTPRLTEEDKQEIIDVYLQCHTIAETHRQTGRNEETIHNVLSEYGISTNKFITDEMLNEIICLFNNGVNTKEIAEKYDHCEDVIVKHLNKNGLFTYRQLWRNKTIQIDEKRVCELYEDGLTLREIVNYFKPTYPYVHYEMIQNTLINNGYCLSRFLESNLSLNDVLAYYKEFKSLKQTAKHFNVTRRALTQYLINNNIQIESINTPMNVVLCKDDLLISFETLMDCAKFVQQNYLPSYTSLRGIRDNISKALKSGTPYKEITFLDGGKNMLKIKTNSNKQLVDEIREKIKLNNGHCVCSLMPTDDNKCMCKDFREQIERNEPGECHCGLYEVVIIED